MIIDRQDTPDPDYGIFRFFFRFTPPRLELVGCKMLGTTVGVARTIRSHAPACNASVVFCHVKYVLCFFFASSLHFACRLVTCLVRKKYLCRRRVGKSQLRPQQILSSSVCAWRISRAWAPAFVFRSLCTPRPFDRLSYAMWNICCGRDLNECIAKTHLANRFVRTKLVWW